MMGGSAEKYKHDEMLPSTIHAIICSPSNCGKINILISLFETPNGVRFEYVRLLEIAATILISRKFTSIDEIGYFMFSNNSDVVPPSEARPNYIFIFDDVHTTSRIR